MGGYFQELKVVLEAIDDFVGYFFRGIGYKYFYESSLENIILICPPTLASYDIKKSA